MKKEKGKRNKAVHSRNEAKVVRFRSHQQFRGRLNQDVSRVRRMLSGGLHTALGLYKNLKSRVNKYSSTQRILMNNITLKIRGKNLKTNKERQIVYTGSTGNKIEVRDKSHEHLKSTRKKSLSSFYMPNKQTLKYTKQKQMGTRENFTNPES